MSAPDPLTLNLEGTIPAVTVAAGTGELVIVAHGLPAGQGSLTRNHQGALYSSNARLLRPWRDSVAAATRVVMVDTHPVLFLPLYPRGVPVTLGAVFTFARPASHYGTGRNAAVLKASAPTAHVGTPDLDRLLRGVLDALTAAGVYDDDRQVVRIVEAARVYPGGHPDALTIPGVTIRVRG